jgi:hypothetical protein
VTETIRLTVPSGPRGAGITALVLGGVGARLDLPIDRVDELTLAVEAVGTSFLGESLELELDVLADRVRIRIGPLADGTTEDPARIRVVTQLVDGVEVSRREGHEWLELDVARGVTG